MFNNIKTIVLSIIATAMTVVSFSMLTSFAIDIVVANINNKPYMGNVNEVAATAFLAILSLLVWVAGAVWYSRNQDDNMKRDAYLWITFFIVAAAGAFAAVLPISYGVTTLIGMKSMFAMEAIKSGAIFLLCATFVGSIVLYFREK